MTYATSSQAQKHIPFTVGASTRPTSTQLSEFLDLVSAEIDTALGARGYTVPVTAPASFLDYLEHLNALGAAAYALLVAFPQESGPGSVAEGPSLMRQYEAKLAKLEAGIGVPRSVAKDENTTAPRSFFLDEGAIGEDVDVEDDWGERIDSRPLFSIGTRPR